MDVGWSEKWKKFGLDTRHPKEQYDSNIFSIIQQIHGSLKLATKLQVLMVYMNTLQVDLESFKIILFK